MNQEDKRWILDRYNKKIEEKSMTLERDGVEIFGDTPFVSPMAGESPISYFLEAYATYAADPLKLLYLDREMYDFLRERFMSTEYIVRGGIK
jgi:spore coat polysaccharide biosynthesis protein SpsF (cytidylyltransferase family)